MHFIHIEKVRLKKINIRLSVRYIKNVFTASPLPSHSLFSLALTEQLYSYRQVQLQRALYCTAGQLFGSESCEIRRKTFNFSKDFTDGAAVSLTQTAGLWCNTVRHTVGVCIGIQKFYY